MLCYILEKYYDESRPKQRLIKQVSCNSKQLTFYKNMLNCVGLLYPLFTLNFPSFYCISFFTIAYSCYFFVTPPKKRDLPSGKPRHINISLFSFWLTSYPTCCKLLFALCLGIVNLSTSLTSHGGQFFLWHGVFHLIDALHESPQVS